MPPPPKPGRSLLYVPRRKVSGQFVGQYRSAFRGAGLDFEEVRPYQYGDDVRAIHWAVSARTPQPYVKLFREERDLTLYLLLDLSASQGYGDPSGQKWATALEIASLLAYGALESNDRLGIVAVTEQVEYFRAATRQRTALMGALLTLQQLRMAHAGTRLHIGLDFLARVMHRRGAVVVISDFLDTDYMPSLQRLHARHELLLLHLSHPEEFYPVLPGIYPSHDLESGHLGWTYAADPPKPTDRPTEPAESCRRLGLDYLALDVTQQPLATLERHLQRRPHAHRRQS